MKRSAHLLVLVASLASIASEAVAQFPGSGIIGGGGDLIRKLGPTGQFDLEK